MSKFTLFVRYIFFCLFFAIGAGSITFSFLAPEMLENYKSMEALERTKINNKKLEDLIDTYDMQINMTKTDPDVLARLEEKTFGTETQFDDTTFPQASEELMKLARKALDETEKIIVPTTTFRNYVEHSSNKRNRMGLFFSGAALILIAFICFGAPKRKLAKKQNPEPQPQT
jgi:hypothetical protein